MYADTYVGMHEIIRTSLSDPTLGGCPFKFCVVDHVHKQLQKMENSPSLTEPQQNKKTGINYKTCLFV